MRIKPISTLYSFVLICISSWLLPTMALSTAPKAKEPGVIPRPVSAQFSQGFFTITPATLVVAEDKAAA
ncbi:MAG: hypothetical protein WBC22_10550, partial [Sedimentisphaerales bacterium]